MTNAPEITEEDLTASAIAWDLEPLLNGKEIDEFLDRADALAEEIEADFKNRISELDAGGLATLMEKFAEYEEILGRVGSYAGLKFSENTTDPANGARLAKVEERATRAQTHLVFFELEWSALDEAHVEGLLEDERLEFCTHYLRNIRRYREHLLTEPEEKLLTEKSVSGKAAWVRLFDELTSAITVEIPNPSDPESSETTVAGLEQGLSLLQHPDRELRRRAAEAITEGLAPGLKTRAYVFNTLLLDKSVDDRLRTYDSWISSRNLANEASDESVQALVDAVVARYDIPQRWYSLKAKVLGLDRLADYDRMASVAGDEAQFTWSEAREIVLDSYASFSPEMSEVAKRFMDDGWLDAPVRPGKRPGAFCAYTVPSHHPYVLLNWTSKARDVSTLAHELGHGIHAWLARDQGIFHQSTPLTLAETASVFGETVTTNALLSRLDDPGARFSLLAEILEGSIATVFRQIAMNRFEDAVHTSRREEGEISPDRFGELWAQTQEAMLGHSVEITEGYRTWWSYIPHFIGTPGYVYAYSYGQLLALSVYSRFEVNGDDFVPAYIEMLSAGGSKSPEELGAIVGCDLGNPSFWDAGLEIVAGQLEAAEAAALEAGRLS
ncbi:MAG: oligoendopeptidase [Acidobacteria bacterium]|nr:MAG: oligoendopeptidase [Acidobacteriota bacterium]